MTVAGAWLEEAGVASVLAGSRVARMAVATRRGPLVTPQLFSVFGGRIWLVAQRGSTRVRVLRRRPEVGMVVRTGRRSVVLTGTAEILEPWGPVAALRLALALPAAAGAMVEYAGRHAARMAGFAAELLQFPPRREALPFDRVLIAVTPVRGAVWTGLALTSVMGFWPGAPDGEGAVVHLPAPPPSEVRRRLPGGLPAAVAGLADGRQACTLGWETTLGPVVLPAMWNPVAWRAEVGSPLRALLAAAPSTAQACISIDRTSALRPSAYSGLVLRGTGRLQAPPGGGPLLVAVAAERVSYWAGFRTATLDMPPPVRRRVPVRTVSQSRPRAVRRRTAP